MKIYKTWNSTIGNYLPAFRNQSFIVFTPENTDEKIFLYEFFNVFLTEFVKDLGEVYEDLKKINQKKSFNEFLLPLLNTDKFYLMTTLEEYIVPRDTFIELVKLVKETFVLLAKKKYKEYLKNKDINRVISKGPLKIVNNNIVINSDTDIKKVEDFLEIEENEFERNMIKFIDNQILSKFDKKKNNPYNQN